jgi:thioredoxin-like negative regulator of GroEL
MSGAGYVSAGQAAEAVSRDAVAKPMLVFFYSPTSGHCRRAEGFLAQALQRRQNHDTFELVRVDVDRRQDLAERFRVSALPTLVVVEGRRAVRRIVRPRGSRQLERELSGWLR